MLFWRPKWPRQTLPPNPFDAATVSLLIEYSLDREVCVATGMWTAVSGAIAKQQVVDSVSNNLANANTPGFKKDQPAFQEYLAVQERAQDGLLRATKLRDRDMYPIDGKDKSFVATKGTFINHDRGALVQTGEPLDLAIDGDAFFEVGTPQGVRLTRQGSFKLAKDGRLETLDGYPVLASMPDGPSTAQGVQAVQSSQGWQQAQGRATAEQYRAREIRMEQPAHQITVDDGGRIIAGDNEIAKLSLIKVVDKSALRKVAGTMFSVAPEATLARGDESTVVQGAIEQSNVNAVEEMTKLIEANRLYEHDLRSIKTFAEMMQKESSEIGKQ